jgi:hypothetical protein
LVRETATLTIAPGTVVTVADGAEILVHGALVAIGDSPNKIKFTVADTATERFNSIRINPLHDKTPQSSSIVHCIIEYSERDMPGATQAHEFWGGGIYASFYRAFGHTLDLSHTEVHHCKAFGGGGVVLFVPGVYIGLSIHHNSLFPRADLHGNLVNYGWGNGMSVPQGQNIEGYDNSFTFDSCNFSYNSGPVENGYVETEGALFISSGSQEAPVLILNSQFIGNSNSWRGVALYSDATVLTLKNCVFKDHIETPLPYGIPQRGVVYIHSPEDNPNFPSFVGNLTATDCLFDNNDRTAIWTSTDDTVSLINTTMRNHFEPSPEYARGSLITMETETVGGGVPDGDVHVNILNTLAWDNDPNEYLVGVAYESATLEIMPVLNIQYSDLQGGNASIDPLLSYSLPSTNIDANPLFATNGQLLANSPCINAGTPDTTGLNLPEFDVFGRERMMYSRVDIGAAEYDGTVSIPETVEFDSEILAIYPNPNSGVFTIRLGDVSGPVNIAIISLDGKVVKEYKFPESCYDELKINDNELTAGAYFIQINSSATRLNSKLLIN